MTTDEPLAASPSDGAPPEPELASELHALGHTLRRHEPAHPTDARWASVAHRGEHLAMQSRQQRITAIAAAAVLAVLLFGVGVAVGGRRAPDPATATVGAANGVTTGTLTSVTDPAAVSPYLGEHRANLALVGALTREGLLGVAAMMDPPLVGAEEVRTARADTDAAIAAYREALAPAERQELLELRSRLEKRFESLAVVRRSVDDRQTPTDQASDQHLAIAADVAQSARARVRDEPDIDVAFSRWATAALAESAAAAMTESTALLRLAGAEPGSDDAARALDTAVRANSQRVTGLEIFGAYATIPMKQSQRDAFAYTSFPDVESAMLAPTPPAGPRPDRGQVLAAARELLDAYQTAFTTTVS